jgi:DNA-binding MarR family transcriptional regulator
VGVTAQLELLRRAFLFRYMKRRRQPPQLTDLDAATLLAILEAPHYGPTLKQQELASLLAIDIVTMSEKITDLARRRLCEIKKKPGERGKFPEVTAKGEAALSEYAQLKYGDVAELFGRFASLPGAQLIMSAVEKILDNSLSTEFSECRSRITRK